MSESADDIGGAYERGELTVARFNDSCALCAHSRPSGRSYLCELKEMRVFADATCSSFAPADEHVRYADIQTRRALYRANLRVEIAVDQHMELRRRLAAVNAGRIG